MKFGMRMPSLRKSFSARTTGGLTRSCKRALLPGYGRKGMGFFRNPGRALWSMIYHRTTFSLWGFLKSLFGLGRR